MRGKSNHIEENGEGAHVAQREEKPLAERGVEKSRTSAQRHEHLSQEGFDKKKEDSSLQKGAPL